MTGAAALLNRLAGAGIEAWAEAGKVRLRGRQPPMDLLAELRQHRAALVAELSQRENVACCDDDVRTTAEQAIRDARLPVLGTPERDRLDREHAAMCAGLLAGYRRHAGGVR